MSTSDSWNASRDTGQERQQEELGWSKVWALYLEHRDVFAGAFASLRKTGLRLDREEEVEFVHEFLVKRAHSALATFRPDKGSLHSWLFVVFKRFVIGALRAEATRRRALARWAEDAGIPERQDAERAVDLTRLRKSIARLPEDERRAVDLFVEERSGSVRRVARGMKVSRWQARDILERAVQRLTGEFGVPSARDR